MSMRLEPTPRERFWGILRGIVITTIVLLFLYIICRSATNTETLKDAEVIGHTISYSEGGTVYYTVVTDQATCPSDGTAYFEMQEGHYYNIVCMKENNRIETYQEVPH